MISLKAMHFKIWNHRFTNFTDFGCLMLGVRNVAVCVNLSQLNFSRVKNIIQSAKKTQNSSVFLNGKT